MSTAPSTIEASAREAPATHNHQLSRFSRGNATSLAPSISGRTRLPSAAGIPGMMNRKIITAPCRVNSWLYWSALTSVLPGSNSSVRRARANMPPRKNATRIEIMYRTAMRL